jgi:hypothetical protein
LFNNGLSGGVNIDVCVDEVAVVGKIIGGIADNFGVCCHIGHNVGSNVIGD